MRKWARDPDRNGEHGERDQAVAIALVAAIADLSSIDGSDRLKLRLGIGLPAHR